MPVDWPRYRELQAEEQRLYQIGPVKLEFTWRQHVEIKHAILLLRRVAGNTNDGDLRDVDRRLTDLVGKPIYDKFREREGASEIREEQMRVLKEGEG